MLQQKFKDMPWYLMSRKNQLVYAHLLNRLQHATIVKMGPFDPLNRETFANVSNVILVLSKMLN